MKSFSQFLQESYIEEEQADQLRILKRDNKTAYDLRKPIGNRGIATDPTPLPANRRLSPAAPEAPKEVPGQQVIRQTSNPPTTKALEPGKPGAPLAKPTNQIPDAMAQGAYDAARSNPRTGTSSNPTATPSTPPSSTPQRRPPAANTTPQRRPPSPNPSARVEVVGKPPSGSPPKPPSGSPPESPVGKLATRGTNPQAPPEAMMRGAYDRASAPRTSPGGSGGKPPALPAAGRTSTPKPSGPEIKVPSGAGKALRVAGKLIGPASAALDVADERAKGSGWLRSGLKAATVAAGSALGGTAGSAAGPIGSIAGATGGAILASKAFDVAAGANAVERKAMATANRQSQAGTAIKGIGGQTSFSQKKPGGPAFMSTGSGSQRKTVQLAKTGVVQRGNQSVAGHLAFKNGQAVYKAGPSAQSLAKTSSNPLERIGRTMFAGAYKKHDAAKAQQALQKARQNDAARQKALGVKALPGK